MADPQRPTRSTALHGDGQTGGPVFAGMGTILRTVLGELLPQVYGSHSGEWIVGRSHSAIPK